jgi:CheY-like chemotaxis protein
MSQSSTASSLEVPTILLAEDSDDDAFFFERALKKSCRPCSFVRAENGMLAIQFLEKAYNSDAGGGGIPDLLFLDLKMPIASGFEVLEWIVSARLNPPLRVIVLSGSNDHADRIRATELGASGYMVKPITSEELTKQIENISKSKEGAPVETRNGF